MNVSLSIAPFLGTFFKGKKKQITSIKFLLVYFFTDNMYFEIHIALIIQNQTKRMISATITTI